LIFFSKPNVEADNCSFHIIIYGLITISDSDIISTIFYHKNEHYFAFKCNIWKQRVLNLLNQEIVCVQFGVSGPFSHLCSKFLIIMNRMNIYWQIDADFLDRKAFNERSVLTPPARYIVTSGGDYSDRSAAISAPYCFVKDSVSGVISEKTAVISEETRVITEETTNTGHLLLNNTHYGTTKEARA